MGLNVLERDIRAWSGTKVHSRNDPGKVRHDVGCGDHIVDGNGEGRLPFWRIDKLIRAGEGKLGDDIRGQAAVQIAKCQDLSLALIFGLEPVRDSIDQLLNEWAVSLDPRGREERSDGPPSGLMHPVVRGCEGRCRNVETILEELQLAVPGRGSVDCLVVFDIVDVNLPRVDAHDWSMGVDIVRTDAIAKGLSGKEGRRGGGRGRVQQYQFVATWDSLPYFLCMSRIFQVKVPPPPAINS